ncbi:outer membrane receptor protein involved in Fe transport [Novosphingobium sp. PhB57]|jgi:outer membrane receptor protein involved in Fe transport|uniref:TonB-dependent receptor n=1 Tax=unclassified Novosphingobium TaxID=2644732 RepID=UPI001044089F|nr:MULTISPECIES: TonB-dependent receptor [unclassified Novosphingobium]TCU58931.1 outer membrane receptor protein involved in Fe transport [Novosphingobium sp. PhB57]TDW61935.1 outer membrane receptor protein involved in Fe transport [Novosphingobium sp. PhB55]
MTHRAKLRAALLTATFFTGAAGATQAMAQDAQDAPAAAIQEGDAIVVTGTRRATTIMDTPINISAIGAEELSRQRIDDVRDLADFTPGLTISDTGPGSTGSIVLRGLNASDVDSNGANYDDSLGIYLGEVPLFYDFKLLDIARVETLLGPQGTLYGLGTLAGAIRYIPNRPNVEEFEGEVHGRLTTKSHSDNFGYQLDGMINIPLVRDHVAFRSATGYYYDPGFIDYPLLLQTPGVSLPQPGGTDGVTREEFAANLRRSKDLNFERTFTTRNQLLIQTTEDLKAIFTYAFQRTRTDGAQSNSNGVLGTGKYQNAARYEEPVNRRAHLASMEINANIADIVDLVSTTAYTNVRTRSQTDNTDLLLDLDYDYELFPAFSSWNESDGRRKQFNQEIRLVSRHGGPFNWVLGGFYNQQKYHNDYAEHTPGLSDFYGVTGNPDDLEYVSYTKSKVTEKAVFGEGTFKITPEWQITGGARYFKYSSDVQGALVLPLLGDPLSPYDVDPAGGKAKKDGWVWKLNTSYNFTPDFMVYGTYSKGYRIGGPNRVAPCPDPVPANQQNACALPNEVQYGPDKTRNAEIGVRMQLFDRKLSFNFDVFHIKWDGIQVDSATYYGVTGITVNGGSAKSQGFETSFQFKPVPQLAIQGSYSYTDAKLTEDVPGIITIRTTPNDYDGRPKFTQLDALSGDRLPGSAKNAGSLGATYTVPMGEGSISANWTATYRGNVVSRIGWDRGYGDKIPSYVLHRATLSYETDKYTVSLFANNIFDKYAVVSVGQDRSRIGVNDGVAVRYYRQTVVNPRTVGVEARIKY